MWLQVSRRVTVMAKAAGPSDTEFFSRRAHTARRKTQSEGQSTISNATPRQAGQRCMGRYIRDATAGSTLPHL